MYYLGQQVTFEVGYVYLERYVAPTYHTKQAKAVIIY